MYLMKVSTNPFWKSITVGIELVPCADFKCDTMEFTSSKEPINDKKGDITMMKKEYTIRNTETGAVQMTGYVAESESEAVEQFLADFPNFGEDEVYASESGWND